MSNKVTKSQLREMIKTAITKRLLEQNADKFDEENEEMLQKRDDRVVETLAKAMKQMQEEVEEMAIAMALAKVKMKKIKTAVMNERWWELEEYIKSSDVESLSNISPHELWNEIEEKL